jgi:long-chain acyl-CoA synthetase
MAIAKQPQTHDAHEITYRQTKAGIVYKPDFNATFDLPPEDSNTLPKNFLRRVQELGDQVAMRKKRYGIWQEYTWRESYEHITDFCAGLVSLGFAQGETLCIVGDNDPEMYWGQMAAHGIRARSCCVFSDALPQDIVFAAYTVDATFLLAHDQEQVDKALAVKDDLPNIRRVIYWEDKGMWSYQDDPWLASFSEIEALGRDYKREHPNFYDQAAAQTQPQDTIIFSMTSGTTSLPKFAMITNWQLCYGNNMNHDYIPADHTQNWLSFSPMAWMTEQAFGFTPHLTRGMTVNFPEGPETVPIDLREIAPYGLLFPSRVWENLASTVRFRVNDSAWLNRKLYEWFMPVAYQLIDLQEAGKPVPPHLRLLYGIGQLAVFGPLRDRVGLTRAKNVLTAGAMLSPDVIRFFRAIGIELRQLYASTETMGTLHLSGDVRLETVGVLVPGVEIKICEDQEILVRTEARFAGYYKAPDKTSEVLDDEGWYHTGDAGYMTDDGHLIYLERVKDLLQLRNGHRFSPQFIEGRLKFSPYIQDIMTIGGTNRDFVSAIIVIDFDNVARWAEKNAISFTTMVDLSQKQQVAALIKADIERVNASLPTESHLHRFVILHKEFDADEGELTRTRKLKRGALAEKYHEIIAALYGDAERVQVRAQVKYRDGRESVVETALQVWDV